MGNIYLIPTTLGGDSIESVIPQNIKPIVNDIKHYIVENIRSARRFLKKVDRSIVIDDLTFYELNKHTKRRDINNFLKPALQNHDMGVISEAGCPGVADPGADIVKIAHEKNIRVIPLVGPSSILLSLMASGMNGQNFAFIGYLPIKKHDKLRKIREIEQHSFTNRQTQIFIEAPYRNAALLTDILDACEDETKLCVACDITLESEFIKTKPVKSWRNSIPDINKRPTIFLLMKQP
jgi:16S rRNA (cytidine1402-2'-O)-methyltransferase